MYNKLTLTFAILFITVINCFSQEEAKHSILLSYSGLGNNELLSFENYDGGGYKGGKSYFGIGINYQYQLSKTFDFESGVEYFSHKAVSSPPFYPFPGLPSSRSQTKHGINTLEIPIGVRLKFLRYFFINTGTVVSFDLSGDNEMDNQTGVGAYLGVGIKYQLNNGICLLFNPYLKMRALLEMPADRFHHKLVEDGFKFGVGYLF
ncbi:outer membrane beta-barrel protein [Flammeovirga sp. EKP202]|uniref:outer membrane beta-barrel protein n=1 Tax=Flammeovirga sp. EKP202 TaxID=2770592 RepID=UPI00165FB3DD|nr:outer membrane beta-barrel protein [Flammeovirga sp. EKP202]MBD0405447.1 outer membrane beta-barrel protein [Flammeovirga sp. EKP202]